MPIEKEEKCYWKILLKKNRNLKVEILDKYNARCPNCDGYRTNCNEYLLERELWSWYEPD